MGHFRSVVLWTAMTAVMLGGIGRPAYACTGDCSGDDQVTVNELITGVNILLGSADVSSCSFFDRDSSRSVAVNELVRGVNALLQGCPAKVINTLAGSGLPGYNGDDLDAIETALYLPQDMTVSTTGELYVVDWNNHRVRRLEENGNLKTIAGTGELGEAKDGEAIYVQFNHPTNVCFDNNGDMLIAAWHNSLVKRLDLDTGLVVNVAGTGARAFGGDGGPANDARLDLPSAVVVDSQNNVIIADQANFRLRKVTPEGVISTICGSSTAGYTGDGGPAADATLRGPRGQAAPPASRIDIDAQDRIYIADTGNHVVRIIDTDGTIRTVAGTGEAGYSGDGGPADEAQLNTPSDVEITANGILYIADTMNNVIRKVAPDGTISTVVGTGERGFSGDGERADAAQLDRPYGVETAANGDLYVADTHNQRLRLVSEQTGPVPTPRPTPTPQIIPCTEQVGSICTYAGNGQTAYNGEGNDRLRTALYWPIDIEFTPRGRRIVLDWNNHQVREIAEDETITTIMGTDFVGDGPIDLSDLTLPGANPLTVDLNHPVDVQEFPDDGDLLVMAWHNHKIRVIDSETGLVRVLMGRGANFQGDGGPAKDALVNQPPHGVLDPNGNLFFIDQRNQRIRVIYNFTAQRENAIIQTVAGSGVKGYNGDGVAKETQFSFPAGGNPEPSGGLALDAQGRIYFSDTQNNRIRRIEFSTADFQTGVVTTIAGTGEAEYSGDGGPAPDAAINNPGDIEVGPDGNLYFADTNNNCVRSINLTTGIIETVSGTGVKGYSGDGGEAKTAQLNRPFGVAFDDAGDLYISDTFNSRVRKVKR